ncbi:MAG: HD domain-containing protein, partial [Planctomycetota bacterium]
MNKEQRLRDPIHGLIRFSSTPKDQLLWALINTREFQRLRRIKQLGLSDLVYPGATHSRFAHSVGTLECARQILNALVFTHQIKKLDPQQELATLCAALLHDIGHGPFSHTFETIEDEQTIQKSHEYWTSTIIENPTTEVHRCLEQYRKGLSKEVIELILADPGTDIYSCIISSQFDADRLDYLVRDRYMSGIDFGHFDVHWLLDSLTVKDIIVETQGDILTKKGLVLSEKGYRAAEVYLMARFLLYTSVYLHKTTRSAEKMLTALLRKAAFWIRQKKTSKTGLPTQHPLAQYFKTKTPELETYLALDDSIVWGALSFFSLSGDPFIATMATRLLNRNLYKCVDIGKRLKDSDTQLKLKFKQILKNHQSHFQEGDEVCLFIDEPKASGYTWYDWDSQNALKKIFFSDPEKGENFDIGDHSK